MNQADEILERLKGMQPEVDQPELLTQRIIDSLPDREEGMKKPTRQPRRIGWRWRYVAAAAGALLVAALATTLLLKTEQTSVEGTVAQSDTITRPMTPAPLTPVDDMPQMQTASNDRTSHESKKVAQPIPIDTNCPVSKQDTPSIVSSVAQGQPTHVQTTELPSATSQPRAQYASNEVITDSTYQNPARMDEFIAKMADYNGVEAVPLQCTGNPADTTVVSRAYVFPDRKEVNVFGRLLQVACWYDSDTPGYLLNTSNQQFFFCLEDPFRQMRYLWMAERLDGKRILLFATHAPLDAPTSSVCYREYRDKLTKTMFN